MTESKKSSSLRVVLVVPNMRWCDWEENTLWHFIPYNLCLLASMIEPFCSVSIIDANKKGMSESDLAREIGEKNPHMVGVTVMMDQYAPAGHKACKIIRKTCPKSLVIMGGVYPTVNPARVMEDKNIHMAVVGEGEYVFRELVLHYLGKSPFPKAGISYRDRDRVVHTGRAHLIENLDELPLPAYHLIDYDDYASHAPRKSVDSPRKYPYARLFTSRGCPVGCVFCQVESIQGRKFRPRSAENVLDEISWLKEKYGVRSLIFDDDNLFTDRKRAVAIFRGMIERGLKMPWVAIAVAEFRLDEDLIEIMRDSGCEYIDIAIESGSDRVLKEVIGKPVNHAHAARMAKKARSCGIYVAGNFIIGFPTETWSEIRETLYMAEAMDLDYVKIFVAIPLKNTKLWNLCRENGYLKQGFSREAMRWSTGQIESSEFSSRDLTILRAYEWDRINFTCRKKMLRTAEIMGISEKELHEKRRQTLISACDIIAGES